MPREFHLSPPGKGYGVSCDAEGAFIGAIPILKRLQKDGKDAWRPRDCETLSEEIGEHYGLPIDISSKTGGLKAIANALNEGNVARAQIATVLLGIPDLPPLAKGTRSREAMIKFIRDLHWSGMTKWDPDKHPRWPAGSAASAGGEFAPEGEGGVTDSSPTSQSDAVDRTRSHSPEHASAARSPRIQLADSARSDASDDPVAEAAARAAAAAGSNAGTARSQATPVDGEHQNFWQTFGSGLSHGAKLVLSRIGQAEIAESNANIAVGTAEAEVIARTLKAYADYRAQPWLDSDGRPIQVSTIEMGDPLSDRAALMGHYLLEPKAPLTRPATNADWIDPLFNLVGAAGAGVPFRFAGPFVDALDTADFATSSANIAERTFATTEGVAVKGSRAIDRAASYETGVRNLYDEMPFSQRKFQTSVDGREVSGVADSTTSSDGLKTAIDAKYVDIWPESLRNPASKIGNEPWAAAEQQKMIQQAKAYSSGFDGGVTYHTNSIEFANFYADLFRDAGIKNYRFVITPASKMGKTMTKNWMEQVYGKGGLERERKVPGTRPGEDRTVRYIAFDDPASVPELFDSVLDQITPRLMKSGGAVLEGTRLELPDGRHFFAVTYHDDVEGWRNQIEQGAGKLGRATARVLAGDVIVSDGQSYPLSSCKIEFD